MAVSPSAGNFSERSRAAKKIIVVDFGFLGDSVHLVPALWEIKRHYPGAALHTLSAVVGAELLKLAPCVNRAWAFPLTPDSPPWWRHLSIIRALRRERFDAAFNFSGSDRTIFVTALMGARWTLAHEGGRKHFWNHWLPVDWVERVSREAPICEQRRQVLAAGGFALEQPRFDLVVPPDARQWAEASVADRPIHFSISASTPVKEWPLENWIELAQMLARENPSIRIVATAGSNPCDQARLRELAAAPVGARLQCFEGLNIPRLAALLQRCRLQIGADSGALHLAMALGLPTLTVFRNYDGLTEWMPLGKEHRHLMADCRCIRENKSDCLLAGRAACLVSITPDRVCATVRQQLQ
jgi:ADP-heptose:LPS heptosyltransferase